MRQKRRNDVKVMLFQFNYSVGKKTCYASHSFFIVTVFILKLDIRHNLYHINFKATLFMIDSMPSMKD